MNQHFEASKKRWSKAIASPWKKNVPHDMVDEYLAKGWSILSTHQNFVTLAWNKPGAPS